MRSRSRFDVGVDFPRRMNGGLLRIEVLRSAFAMGRATSTQASASNSSSRSRSPHVGELLTTLGGGFAAVIAASAGASRRWWCSTSVRNDRVQIPSIPTLTPHMMQIRLRPCSSEPVRVWTEGTMRTLGPEESWAVPLSPLARSGRRNSSTAMWH